MCEFCTIVSSETKDIGDLKNEILYIERHNNTYIISVNTENNEEDEITMNYCIKCGRKLKKD